MKRERESRKEPTEPTKQEEEEIKISTTAEQQQPPSEWGQKETRQIAEGEERNREASGRRGGDLFCPEAFLFLGDLLHLSMLQNVNLRF